MFKHVLRLACTRYTARPSTWPMTHLFSAIQAGPLQKKRSNNLQRLPSKMCSSPLFPTSAKTGCKGSPLCSNQAISARLKTPIRVSQHRNCKWSPIALADSALLRDKFSPIPSLAAYASSIKTVNATTSCRHSHPKKQTRLMWLKSSHLRSSWLSKCRSGAICQLTWSFWCLLITLPRWKSKKQQQRWRLNSRDRPSLAQPKRERRREVKSERKHKDVETY